MSRRRAARVRAYHRRVLLESLEQRLALDSSAWHNLVDSYDVNPGATDKTAGLVNLIEFVVANDGKGSAVPPFAAAGSGLLSLLRRGR